ncbi:nitrate reductase molybdenum cofactor assembly chaperone [Nocardioides sp. TF02-7]|uniref:nitrate reductase molybdenum cofactor assembly chaperone n=1 Tax=Nocardioides sp. TF02-7 TaxID=2917724 RepID=UPI001F069D77|nr:nitrate reductase molybdenum cofactor assembly chaperone [Nocardioides sp. TF02-7]UMG93457.1 nitrate reductase molybdenum cofactor assembly chaperone [Nocardioides sp. TF02-7]
MNPLRRRTGGLDRERLGWTWQAASLLLGYPDDDLLANLPVVRRVVAELPPAIAGPLSATLDHLATTAPEALWEEYVETFDTRRRHNLFLTYFAHGDTRKRGVALLRFRQTYLESGFVPDDSELPDHLCVVLEFAATIDQERGRRLLLDHRAGLELLRLSLGEAGSPWAGAVTAVSATLPPLGDDEWAAVRRLAAEGPPEEEVGMTPYDTPAFDPGAAAPAAAPDGPVLLPTPSFPGAR